VEANKYEEDAKNEARTFHKLGFMAYSQVITPRAGIFTHGSKINSTSDQRHGAKIKSINFAPQ
jgi:hypothetical protein